MTLKALPILLLLLQVGAAQTSGTVFGIGIGTFIIILAIVFSVFWCLICRSSDRPQVYSIVGILLPVVLIIIFIFLPKEKDRPASSNITDSNYIPHIVFMLLLIIGALIALAYLCVGNCFVYKRAKNVARAAFMVRQDEEDERLQSKLIERPLDERESEHDQLKEPSSQH